MEHIVIIGNGVSGVTAARHIRKLSDKQITIISDETDFFFSRTALMYVFMGHMKFKHTQPYENAFWKKNNIALKKGFVTTVDTDKKELLLSDDAKIAYDKLIIATGSKPNKFGWPGQDLDGVMGLYHKQDLDYLEKHSKGCNNAVIVGGGLIGIELAEMLLSRNISVTFLVREASFWDGVLPKEESAMINRHILEHHIDLRLETHLKEILPDNDGKVKAVVTDRGEIIECQIVGLTAGVSPNINFLENSGIKIDKGAIVNRYLETNVKDVYAIGDCAQQEEAIGHRKPIEAVWYTGRMMGEAVAQTICGNKTPYNPGHWFNSAKFLDIEYQTYGWVFPKPLDYEQQFYWEHPKGKKCIRIAYHKKTNELLGVNSLGIRLRHEVIDKWLTEKRSVNYVIKHFEQANFDPEFFSTHEKEIQQRFNSSQKV
ncbi:FAD/NAD(P)-binding oxidoreductase [Leptobacterium sp. I13]|uniref:NAD(P)/FAD-dependent oxidoreductase n=1 Tax=Leptobacterium meishanense TaxID=3128904 RepID=UPI0030EBBC0D